MVNKVKKKRFLMESRGDKIFHITVIIFMSFFRAHCFIPVVVYGDRFSI